MSRTSRVGMRLLKVYVFAAASLLIVVTLSAFQNQAQRTRFEVIDVERMNIVEKDGKVRIVLSNKARFPGLMVRGQDNPYPRDVAGIVLINENGTEYGTLATQTRRASGDFGAYSGLRFGAFGQGQGVGMLYDDDNGQREAGVFITDAPTTAAAQLLERVQAARAKPEGQERTRALEEVNAWARAQGIFRQRLRAQTTRDRSAIIELADTLQRPRLRMVVDSVGGARLEFLGDSGQVVRAIRASSSSTAAQRSLTGI